MSNTRKRRPRSLQAALKAKKVRRTFYDVPLVESEDADAAGQRLAEAKQMQRAARMTAARMPDDTDVAEGVKLAEAEFEAAQKAFDECFYRVYFRGLSGKDRNALDNAIQPEPVDLPDDATDEQKAEAETKAERDADERWIYALLEACAEQSTMTADDWREELASERWTQADANAIKAAVLMANQQEFSAAIPKG